MTNIKNPKIFEQQCATQTVQQRNIDTLTISFLATCLSKRNDRLTISVFVNSLLRTKVICTVAISNNDLYNNNISNMKIRELRKHMRTFFL